MLRQRISDLFKGYDPATQQVVREVIDLEQRYISMQRPRISGDIDEIITRIAQQDLDRDSAGQGNPSNEA